MKVRIDIRGALSDPLHPVRILLYVLVAIAILAPAQAKLLQLAGWGNKAAPVFYELPQAYPAVLAGGIEVAEGRLQSSGSTARGVWSGQVSTTLVALLIAYVAGPAALVWGLRARSRYRQNVAVKGGAIPIALALAFGGALLVTSLTEPVYAIVGTRDLAMMSRDHRFMETYDAVETELYAMARRAQIRYFRSGSERGRGHSWLCGNASGAPAIHMADLVEPAAGRMPADSMMVRFGETAFSLQVQRADSLTLRGSVPFALERGSVRTPEWMRDTIVVVVGVTPLNVNMSEEP